MQKWGIYLNKPRILVLKNHMSIEPSPFLPQTTIAIEKVKIAANAAQPSWKIIMLKPYI